MNYPTLFFLILFSHNCLCITDEEQVNKNLLQDISHMLKENNKDELKRYISKVYEELNFKTALAQHNEVNKNFIPNTGSLDGVEAILNNNQEPKKVEERNLFLKEDEQALNEAQAVEDKNEVNAIPNNSPVGGVEAILNNNQEPKKVEERNLFLEEDEQALNEAQAVEDELNAIPNNSPVGGVEAVPNDNQEPEKVEEKNLVLEEDEQALNEEVEERNLILKEEAPNQAQTVEDKIAIWLIHNGNPIKVYDNTKDSFSVPGAILEDLQNEQEKEITPELKGAPAPKLRKQQLAEAKIKSHQDSNSIPEIDRTLDEAQQILPINYYKTINSHQQPDQARISPLLSYNKIYQSTQNLPLNKQQQSAAALAISGINSKSMQYTKLNSHFPSQAQPYRLGRPKIVRKEARDALPKVVFGKRAGVKLDARQLAEANLWQLPLLRRVQTVESL